MKTVSKKQLAALEAAIRAAEANIVCGTRDEVEAVAADRIASLDVALANLGMERRGPSKWWSVELGWVEASRFDIAMPCVMTAGQLGYACSPMVSSEKINDARAAERAKIGRSLRAAGLR